MRGFKPFDDDWPRVGRITQLTTDPDAIGDELVRRAWPDFDKVTPMVPRAKWRPTDGKDMTGHDFGSEEIWLYHGPHYAITRVRTSLARWPNVDWRRVTHWLPAEAEPEPPE